MLHAELHDLLEAALGDAIGHDSEGFAYDSISHLWHVEGSRRASRSAAQVDQAASETPAWYVDAKAYWDRCPPTVDGVLGGYGSLSPKDVKGSAAFLRRLWALRPGLGRVRAVDCGAGIGRVAKHLLLPLFDEVHLLEQSPPLLEAAPAFLGAENVARTTLLCQGMQDFCPPPGTYDVVWIQWVIGHLTDIDLVAFLHRCDQGLAPGGVICIKDNCYHGEVNDDGSEELFYVDRDDSSVTRATKYFDALFQVAGFRVVARERQEEFPDELFPVWMVCLERADEKPQHRQLKVRSNPPDPSSEDQKQA